METSNCPLVSVPVITYNSSKTVLETLESIKSQTYQNIELIISDDCSTDDTVQLCKEWVDKNIDRFVNAIVIESPINTGISANCNRAERACQGEWIKTIAGDDILLPECITSLIEYISETPEVNIVFGRVIAFGENSDLCEAVQNTFDNSIDILKDLSYARQMEEMFKGFVPPAPSCIYNRNKIVECGLKYDERIRNIEDYPRWINVLSKGIKLFFLDNYIVKYRVGSGVSLSSYQQSVEMYKCRRQVFFYYIFRQEYMKNPDTAVEALIEEECVLYHKYLDYDHFVNTIKRNFLYKIIHSLYRMWHSIFR